MTNKTFQRPTIQTRYDNQIQKDRRQAALDRRNEQITELQERKALYANVGA